MAQGRAKKLEILDDRRGMPGPKVGAVAVERIFAAVGFDTPERIAEGLGIGACQCGREGADLVRTALRHKDGVPKLLYVLATAVRSRYTKKFQDRAMLNEDRVLRFLLEYPLSSTNRIIKTLRFWRNGGYALVSNMADAELIVNSGTDGRGNLWTVTEKGQIEYQKGRGLPEVARQAEEEIRRADGAAQAATREVAQEGGAGLPDAALFADEPDEQHGL
jgi:hypothetical protein